MKHFFAALMAAALALPALAQDDTGPTAPAADAPEPETESGARFADDPAGHRPDT